MPGGGQQPALVHWAVDRRLGGGGHPGVSAASAAWLAASCQRVGCHEELKCKNITIYLQRTVDNFIKEYREWVVLMFRLIAKQPFIIKICKMFPDHQKTCYGWLPKRHQLGFLSSPRHNSTARPQNRSACGISDEKHGTRSEVIIWQKSLHDRSDCAWSWLPSLPLPFKEQVSRALYGNIIQFRYSALKIQCCLLSCWKWITWSTFNQCKNQ